MVFRLPPKMPTTAYQSYRIVSPQATHFRVARCDDPAVDCAPHREGWTSRVDEATMNGRRWAHLIRTQQLAKFIETRDGALTVFRFPAGQLCFRASKSLAAQFGLPEHVVRTGRPETFLVGPGHYLQPTGESRVHARASDWVEDFAGHLDKINTAIARG